MATLRRRNLRSPGQTSGWKEHPSDTGSKSYYANTGRGWVPKNQPNLNTAAINARRNTREPGITGRPSWRTFDYTPSQGYDRSGPARGNLQDYGRNYRNIELANRRGLGSLAEDKGMGLLGHLNQWLGRDEDAEGFSMGDLPLPKVMKMAGDTISDAARGSRLMNKYQDLAVQEGRSKASGFKDWENDKKAMMTAKDRAFYNKYMNLADMAQDSTKAQEYRDTAETAWRNKQTSDRLSAITQFEGYNPSKYTGEGEGSRYTGSHREAPDRVPGYDRIREVWGNLNMGGGSPQDYETGEHWTDTSGEVAEIGPDYEIGEHWNIDDTPFGLTETEDITADYTPYPDEKWDAPLDHPYAGIYDFERQRPKSTFTPKLYDEDRTHSTLPLGPRRITSEPGQVTYPFGPNLLDPYYGIDLASDVALGNRGYGTGPDEIFEEDEVYFPNNPKSKILGG